LAEEKEMKSALGIIEIIGLTTAIKTADAMVKTANVTLQDIEPAKGFGYMTIKVLGDVGAVDAAVQAGKNTAQQYGKYVASAVLARPARELDTAFLKASADTGKAVTASEKTAEKTASKTAKTAKTMAETTAETTAGKPA